MPKQPNGRAVWRGVRWAVQLLFLGLFVALFVLARYGKPAGFQHLFLRFDPLVLLVVSIAGRAIVGVALPALVLVGLTLVLGRFFCGYVCPLGTSIDLFDAFAGRRAKAPHWLRYGKYATLAFLLAAAGLGASFIGCFDPLVIYERTLTVALYPAYRYIANGLHPVRGYVEVAGSLALFAGILALGLVQRRFWCRNLCPLGGLYALFAKLSLLKFAWRNDCRHCKACERACPTDAIDSDRSYVDAGECIDCGACGFNCPDKAIAYRVHARPARFDVGRRQAIAAIGSAVVLAPLARGLLHKKLQGRLIRPPGAVPEPEFLNACVRCGLCMKVCPTGGLQPTLFEAGVEGAWSPRLVPRIGGCEKNCNLCGQHCPTGAIRNLPLEEKSYARLGTAVIDRSRCIAWEQNRVCLVCDEACQYNAIETFSETIQGQALLRPFVDERLCVGCGICESRCPVDGPAAIQVFRMGEERRRTGSYITEDKVKLRCNQQSGEDVPSGFIQE
jgi:ferredoxin